MIKEFQGEYRWLSNFWMAKVSYEGMEYQSAEHAYQAAKSADPEIRKKIAGMYPGQAKKFAKTIQIRPDWNEVRVGIMLDLLRQKFNIPGLKETLLATGDAHLQEGNLWYNKFWGVCLRTGEGQNILGKLIMQVRDEIRKEVK